MDGRMEEVEGSRGLAMLSEGLIFLTHGDYGILICEEINMLNHGTLASVASAPLLKNAFSITFFLWLEGTL